MAKSLKQVVNQIRKLEREAEMLRKREVSRVIDRIRIAIDHYALTPQELFGQGAGTAPASESRRAGRRSAPGSGTTPKRSGSPKYAHADGRTWTGVGKRPSWFVDALSSGKTADEMLIDSRDATPSGTVSSDATVAKGRRSTGASKPGKRASARGLRDKGLRYKGAQKARGVPKYHDGSGRTWTGVGKRPAWFVQALASGRTSDDLLIPPA
ncbi:MAG: hypothetical protein EOP37_11075 [Rubrivivax sp.]|nr:MAG: hypothetical protein EOP37_11075 [Rubrivivax sp.]